MVASGRRARSGPSVQPPRSRLGGASAVHARGRHARADSMAHPRSTASTVARGNLLSARLQQCVRHTDLAVRFGGDEFVLLLDPPPADPTALSTRLATAIAAPPTWTARPTTSGFRSATTPCTPPTNSPRDCPSPTNTCTAPKHPDRNHVREHLNLIRPGCLG